MSNDNFYEINRILSNLDEKILIQIANSIDVKKSKNINITGNSFSNVINLYFDNHAFTDEVNACQNIDLKFEEALSENKVQRAIMNIDYMERFIFECNRRGISPVFRYYGLFSHLSTLRSKWDYSDYNQLVLKEKSLFEQMLELNYKIKLIISLDIPIIITKWGYSLRETKNRIADLCDNVDLLTSNHNIDIVIDEKNSMDGMYILDDCLLIRAINIDPIKKYNITKYEANKHVIKNMINEFDGKFSYLRIQNNAVKKMLKINTYQHLIKAIIEANMEAYTIKMDKGMI